MNAKDFTDEEIREIARAGYAASPLGTFDQADINCAIRHLDENGGEKSPFAAAVHAKAHDIIVRRKRDLDADAIARAMQGLPPVLNEAGAPTAPNAAPIEMVAGCDYQGAEAGPYVSATPAQPAPPVAPAAPDPTRAPLDAMLRFVCGHPQGVRWLGERDHADVQRIARAFRPDHPVERKSCEPLASCLLTKLNKLLGTTLARWLSIDEQREYNRLHAALKAAVAEVRR